MENLTKSIKITFDEGKGSKKKIFYVYVHIDSKENVFYVGRGKGNRVWDLDRRHQLWYRYVDKFKGMFRVQIVRNKLDEDEALWFENELMEKYRGQIVNPNVA